MKILMNRFALLAVVAGILGSTLVMGCGGGDDTTTTESTTTDANGATNKTETTTTKGE